MQNIKNKIFVLNLIIGVLVVLFIGYYFVIAQPNQDKKEWLFEQGRDCSLFAEQKKHFSGNILIQKNIFSEKYGCIVLLKEYGIDFKEFSISDMYSNKSIVYYYRPDDTSFLKEEDLEVLDRSLKNFLKIEKEIFGI